MKYILPFFSLLLFGGTSLAVEVPVSLAKTTDQTISNHPGAHGKVSLTRKLPRIRIDSANKGFVDTAGKRFIPGGLSYYRPGTGWAPQLWKTFDAEATRRDFQHMKRLGLNVARVFVTYGSFYTQPGQLDPAGLAAFDRMLNLADEAGIYLHPTGPEGWEGFPAWTNEQGEIHHNFANEASLKAKEDFWRMFVGRYRGRSTIWAYDLRNEPTVPWDTPHSRVKWDQWRTARQQPIVPVPDKESAPSAILADYQRFRESVAEEWVARQAKAIKTADPEALVTLGLLQWSVPAQPVKIDQYTGFRPENIARHLDFVSLHFYPLAHGVYRYQNQAAEDANLAVLESMVRECAKPGKPVVIGEFGWYGGGALDPGGKPADEGQQARWGRRVVEVTAPMVSGWINWGLYDTPEAKDVSRLTGLLTIQGEDKEWGKIFGPLVQSQPPAHTLPARPDLPWESATMDGEAMTRFQAEYLAAFLPGQSVGVLTNGSHFSVESHPTEPQTILKAPPQIHWIRDGSWVAYHKFDFKSGVSSFTVNASSDTAGGTIELRLGSPEGEKIGEVNIAKTASWESYASFKTNALQTVSGIKDLYLVFRGTQAPLFNLQNFKFEPLHRH